MSSIRLFVLDAVARRGEMHGHPLRLLAEGEQPDALPSAAPPIPGGLAARRPATPAAPPGGPLV